MDQRHDHHQRFEPHRFFGEGQHNPSRIRDEDAALKVARKIALETGRLVTVRGEDNRLIGTIPLVTMH